MSLQSLNQLSGALVPTDVLGPLYERSLRVNANCAAIEDPTTGRRFTYRDVEDWSKAIAFELAKVGIGPGTVVALLIGNSPEFIACDVALALLGAVKVPINDLLPPTTIHFILGHCAAAAVIVDPERADLLEASVDASPVLRFVIGGSKDSNGCSSARLPGMETSVNKARREQQRLAGNSPAVDSDAPAAIYYTGGTTGRPRGVLHTQASTVALHRTQMLEAEIRQHERLLLMTPLAHAAGLFAQTALLRGATIVLTRSFDPAAALRLVQDHRITWAFLVPTMIYRLLDAMDGGVFSEIDSLDTIVYGAAPIAPSRIRRALAVFGPIFVQLYGQTECPNWGTRLAKRDHDLARPKLLESCGQASINCDVRVVDERAVPVPAGTIGEVCLRSDYVMREYVADPAATAEKFVGAWIRTGDVGLQDEDGYLYLKDRRADMVISGGMNVYCREVEAALGQHPDVLAVAVIGIPHEDWGESVHAVVVRNADLEAGALIDWSRPRLAAYARPKSVDFVDSLPETPLGKIDKKALRRTYWRGRDRDVN